MSRRMYDFNISVLKMLEMTTGMTWVIRNSTKLTVNKLQAPFLEALSDTRVSSVREPGLSVISPELN